MIRRHLYVSGRVQGVFYRDSCRREAVALGVAGWARNLGDGRVEVVAEGDPYAIAALVDWCHRGSAQASVQDVAVTEESPEGLTGFTIG